MKNFISILTIVVLFQISCLNTNIKDDFNAEKCLKFKTTLFNRYKKFNRQDSIKYAVDYIQVYSLYCKFKSKPYDIIQAGSFVDNNAKPLSSMSYELIHFKNLGDLDVIISEIKHGNCIDAFNMKLHRIYKIGPCTAIFVNFINFNIKDFQNFCSKWYPALKVEIIN